MGSVLNRFAAPAAMFGGAIFTWLVLRQSDLLPVQLTGSPTHLAAAAGFLVLSVVTIRRPDFGLVLLLAVVWLHLSQLLVRYHGLPSLLQLLFVPLALAAWASWLRARDTSKEHPLVQPLTIMLAAYVLVLLLSTTWASDRALADERVIEAFKAFWIYALVTSLAISLPWIVRGAAVLVGAGAFLAGLGIVQVAIGASDRSFGGLAHVKRAHIYSDVIDARITGPLGDPNYFAQILLVLVPLALLLARHAATIARRGYALVCAALLFAGIVLTYSRGAAIALTAVLLLTLLALGVSRTKLAALLAAVMVGATFLLPADFTHRLVTIGQFLPGGVSEEALNPDGSFEKRRLVTTVALQEFLDHPVFGVGAGNYTVHFDRYAARVGSGGRDVDATDERHMPHNLYLEVAAETGIIGLIAFGAAIVTAFGALRRARRGLLAAGDAEARGLVRAFEIALVGYLVSSLFLHGDFQRYLWVLFAFAAAFRWIAAQEVARGMESVHQVAAR